MEQKRTFVIRDMWQANSYYQNGHRLLAIASDKNGPAKLIFEMTPSEELDAYKVWRDEKANKLGWNN